MQGSRKAVLGVEMDSILFTLLLKAMQSCVVPCAIQTYQGCRTATPELDQSLAKERGYKRVKHREGSTAEIIMCRRLKKP